MGRLFLLEMRNCINRKEFQVSFGILFFLSIGSFLVTCYRFFGHSLHQVRSASESSMLLGVYSTSFVIILTVLLPLLSTLIYSDSFYSDVKSGVYKSIITRTSFTKYVSVKTICIFVITFLTFFTPIMLNQLLSLIAFPIEGYDNNFSLPPYVIDFTEENMFELLKLESPYLYNCLYAAIISISAGLISVLAFAIYFYTVRGKFYVNSGIFLGYILSHLFFSGINLKEYSLLSYFRTDHPGSPSILLGWMFLLLASSLLMIMYRVYRFDPDIN